MGYTTDFDGAWAIVPPLTEEHRAYLTQFAEIRHMARDNVKLASMPDPLREAVGLPLGVEGEYYVGTAGKYDSQGYGFGGGPKDESILNGNNPASSQPGLWCQWVPDADGAYLQWDEGEKFYNYIEWLKYLIERFFNPWGYSLCGEMSWRGEEYEDFGLIKIESPSNEVLVAYGSQTYGSFQRA